MGFWQFATGGGSGGGTGDVVGPASSTDNAIARFDGATGKLIQNSGVTVADGLTGGVIVGSTGATDLGIIIANGTGGSTVQASAATLTAAGSLTIPSAETIEWSTDTGIARRAAGVVKVTDGSTGYGSLDVRGGTTEASIRFGGTTTSFPALGTHASVNTSGLHVYDAAISGWSSIDALAFFPHNGGTASVKFWNSTPSKAQISATDGLLITDFGGGSMAPIFAIYKVEANTAGSGSPNVLTAGESMTVLTNEGVTAKNYHTLPSAVAGYRFTFIVQDADGMRIVANTDDTIRVIDKVTAAAGYIESTTIGSVVTLVSINAVEWYATSIHGVWTDGTFTYDDTSLTTP